MPEVSQQTTSFAAARIQIAIHHPPRDADALRSCGGFPEKMGLESLLTLLGSSCNCSLL